MYPHFIEVHQNGIPMLMNIDHIICTSDKCNKQEWKSVVMVTGCSVDEAWGLDETYDELKQLITNSGCLIQMSDPRLDITHPLTMADLKDMVGQPVWDSNRNVWYLLKTFDEDGQAHFTDVFGNTGIAESEDALINYPLYRMRRDNDRLYIPDGYTQAKTGSKNHD